MSQLGRTEAGGIFRTLLLSHRQGEGSALGPMGWQWHGEFPSPFPALWCRMGMLQHCAGWFGPWLSCTTATWCISLGHVLLLGEGSPSTSNHQVLPYILIKESSLHLVILLGFAASLVFWKLLTADGLRAISGSHRPSSWGLGLGTFARQPTPQKHPSAIYFSFSFVA